MSEALASLFAHSSVLGTIHACSRVHLEDGNLLWSIALKAVHAGYATPAREAVQVAAHQLLSVSRVYALPSGMQRW